MNESAALGLIALLLAGGMIGGAQFMEHILGLDPCPLCLMQRLWTMLGGAVVLAGLALQSSLAGLSDRRVGMHHRRRRVFGASAVAAESARRRGSGVRARHGIHDRRVPAQRDPQGDDARHRQLRRSHVDDVRDQHRRLCADRLHRCSAATLVLVDRIRAQGRRRLITRALHLSNEQSLLRFPRERPQWGAPVPNRTAQERTVKTFLKSRRQLIVELMKLSNAIEGDLRDEAELPPRTVLSAAWSTTCRTATSGFMRDVLSPQTWTTPREYAIFDATTSTAMTFNDHHAGGDHFDVARVRRELAASRWRWKPVSNSKTTCSTARTAKCRRRFDRYRPRHLRPISQTRTQPSLRGRKSARARARGQVYSPAPDHPQR